MFGPVLRGEKCTLRPPRKEELSVYQRWFEDVDVLHFTPGIGPFSDSQEKDWFKRVGEDPNAVQWVIEVEGKPVGFAGIGGINWRRKRIASAAMILRTAFCFRELNLHKIRTRAFMENEASKRALQKAGYRESGIQREEMFRDGRWHDIWMAEVQREDWEKSQAKL